MQSKWRVGGGGGWGDRGENLRQLRRLIRGPSAALLVEKRFFLDLPLGTHRAVNSNLRLTEESNLQLSCHQRFMQTSLPHQEKGAASHKPDSPDTPTFGKGKPGPTFKEATACYS